LVWVITPWRASYRGASAWWTVAPGRTVSRGFRASYAMNPDGQIVAVGDVEPSAQKKPAEHGPLQKGDVCRGELP